MVVATAFEVAQPIAYVQNKTLSTLSGYRHGACISLMLVKLR